MELHLNLHEKYFLNTIIEKLSNKSNVKKLSNKYESFFLSGIFWVLSGLLIVNKNRKKLDEILEKEIIEIIYLLVMQCLQTKKIKEKYIYNMKKEKYFFSDKDIDKLMNKVENDSKSNKVDFKKIKKSEDEKIDLCSLKINFDEKNKNINKKHSNTNSCAILEYPESKKIINSEVNSQAYDEIYNENKKKYKLEKKKKKVKKFIIRGFSPCNKKYLYEPNVISTLSAIQILFLLNKVSENDISTKVLLEIYNFIYFLLDEERGFFHFSLSSIRFQFDGDMRFMFCSLSSLYLINLILKKRNIWINIYNNKDKYIHWIINCFNLDGGFSNYPGSESHAGTTFCAINSLNLLKDENNKNYFSYNSILKKKLIRWLCDRYENYGINGRVGKDHDVCYAWWVLSSLVAMKKDLRKLFNVNILINFILKCQDKNKGGFSRIEQNENNLKNQNFNYFENENLIYRETDQFHSFFSICALSLIYYNVYYKKKRKKKYIFFDNSLIPKHLEESLSNLENVHESFAMPVHMLG
ncbi:geranylgeranyl transferase type2 beta subunit, putative [Plasmodium relictum]|uniref:Geranylgeranyl transferase type II subunit beta n=1 Tax=Plasmodium relictum TaxID=85471 RepID=A0A1J1HAX1_PLARL|nr:geranylgeranyl transferase type2 beta subunit, putative [Plasmodium relictum]CRH02572.1 geranylgeranyl transferase type2 beta subunit, putative [Plasmodium relictum]